MDFKDLQNKIDAVIKNVGSLPRMVKVANETKKMVQERTRQGFGVKKTDTNKVRLKKLSPSYKKRRKKLQKKGLLSDKTTPNKSNLTQKGEMIDTLKTQVSRNKAEVKVNGDKNQKKAKQQAKAGRKFMDLSKTELKKVLNIIKQDIKDDITKKGL